MSVRLRFLPLFLFFCAIAGHAGFAGDAKKPPLILSTDISGGDLQFLRSATELGLLEASLGALAATHAQSSEVKTFGQNLAKYYAIQNEQVKLLAIRKGLAVSSHLNARQNAIVDKLEKLQGVKFDKAYMEQTLQDQQNYVSIFEQTATSHDLDVKSFVVASMPVLKEHLALVRNILGVSPSSKQAPPFRADIPQVEEQ